MNAKISVLVICFKAIIYLLLYNLHDCTFDYFQKKLHLSSKKLYINVEHVAVKLVHVSLQWVKNIMKGSRLCGVLFWLSCRQNLRHFSGQVFCGRPLNARFLLWNWFNPNSLVLSNNYSLLQFRDSLFYNIQSFWWLKNQVITLMNTIFDLHIAFWQIRDQIKGISGHFKIL